MALIGPRPERPAFCAEFEKRIHGWNYRALVKPGLSGLAQVRGGYDLLPKEKVALDLWRVGYPSLRIARVTDPPHSSIISTALRLCSSVQLGIRELLTGPIRSNYLSAPPSVQEGVANPDGSRWPRSRRNANAASRTWSFRCASWATHRTGMSYYSRQPPEIGDLLP